MVTMEDLSFEEKVDVILIDVGRFGISVVQDKLVFRGLPNDRMLQFDLHGVIV